MSEIEEEFLELKIRNVPASVVNKIKIIAKKQGLSVPSFVKAHLYELTKDYKTDGINISDIVKTAKEAKPVVKIRARKHIEGLEECVSVKEFTSRFGSRSFLYGLINKGILKPHYLGSKPFFYVKEISAIMNGG